MPQINLLSPSHGKKVKKAKFEEISPEKKGPPLTLVNFFIVIIAVLMVLVWLIMGVRINKYSRELTALEKKEKTFAVEPQRLIKLNEQKEALSKRLKFLEKFAEKKFSWTDKLGKITEFIPEGVWLTDLATDRKIDIDIDGQTIKQEQSLISIKGRAVSQAIQEAVDLVGVYLDSLKKDDDFSRDFKEIKLNSLTKGAILNRDIMNFEFYCIIK